MAVLQFNDPDPAYWILIYGGVSALGFAAAWGKMSRFWTTVTLGVALAGLVIAFPGFGDYLRAGDPASLTGAMMPEKPWVEPAREFIGMLMAMAVLVWYLKRQYA